MCAVTASESVLDPKRAHAAMSRYCAKRSCCRPPEAEGQGAFLVTEKRVIKHAFLFKLSSTAANLLRQMAKVSFEKANGQACAIYNARSLAVWGFHVWSIYRIC